MAGALAQALETLGREDVLGHDAGDRVTISLVHRIDHRGVLGVEQEGGVVNFPDGGPRWELTPL